MTGTLLGVSWASRLLGRVEHHTVIFLITKSPWIYSNSWYEIPVLCKKVCSNYMCVGSSFMTAQWNTHATSFNIKKFWCSLQDQKPCSDGFMKRRPEEWQNNNDHLLLNSVWTVCQGQWVCLGGPVFSKKLCPCWNVYSYCTNWELTASEHFHVHC